MAARQILFVAHEVRTDGGMEKALRQTIEGLIALGWEVTLIAKVCDIPPQPRFRWVQLRLPTRPFLVSFPLFAVCAGFAVRLYRRPQQVVVTLGAIIPNSVDAAIVQFCQAGFAQQGLTRSMKDTAIYRLSGRLALKLALGLERWCYRPARVRRLIAVSDLVRSEILDVYSLDADSVVVIPNGVDTETFAPDDSVRAIVRSKRGIDPDDLVALFVGGDWERKGLEIAISACGNAGWTLLVLGRGDVTEWSRRADQAGARVQFWGHVERPEAAFQSADAFLLPSSYEGFALVTVEAASAGLPLLVTEATGAGQLVRDSGFASLPRQRAAFSEALQVLASEPARRSHLGSRLREQASLLSWDKLARRYDHHFSVLADTPQS